MTAILGVDPGGRFSGFCIVDDVLGVSFHQVIERQGDEWCNYLSNIVNAIESSRSQVEFVAIEAVTKPKAYFGGKKQMLNPQNAMDTSRVFGAVEGMLIAEWGQFPVVVPAGGNGSGDLSAYPPQLVGPRERSGGGILNHARSAYDVCLVAAKQLGIQLRPFDPAVRFLPREERAPAMSVGGHTFAPRPLPDENPLRMSREEAIAKARRELES